MKELLFNIYSILLNEYGNRKWWPAKTKDEIIIGAILTQNVSWRNVKKAIDNLRDNKLITLKSIQTVDLIILAPLIKSTRYYNQKSLKLKRFTDYLFINYCGHLELMFEQKVERLRNELLNIKGLGEETVDSILLYAGNKSTFVIDTYTIRILKRLGIGNEEWKYKDYQRLFIENLDNDLALYKDYHAQLVHLGNLICKLHNPKCNDCPINTYCKNKAIEKFLLTNC